MQDFSNGRIKTQEITPEPYQLYRREEQDNSPQHPLSDRERLLRDFDYFKSMYPEQVKQLQLSVDAVIDEMEYEGSPIYDEYPDRVLLEQLTRKAAERVGIQKTETEGESEEAGKTKKVAAAEIHVAYGPVRSGACLWENGAVYSQEMRNRSPWDRNPPPRPNPPWRPPGGPNPPWGPPPGPTPPPRPKPPGNQWDLLRILLMHELQRRRCRSGRCR
ncbi:MAG: hypothetical protein ACI4OO_10700 [Otoolea sp.]